jgi:FHS family L-fucose permease-like MFS transporter
LAGSINSLGTTLGPVIFSVALYGTANQSLIHTEQVGIEALKMPFLILSGLFVLLAVFLGYSKLPTLHNEEVSERKIGALQYPQLVLGMIAIFIYVGVEVTIQSNMGALLELPSIKGIDHTQVGKYISLYWGSLMIGRWTGALNVFNLKKSTKQLLNVVVPFLAFGFVLFFNSLSGNNVTDLYIYAAWIVLFIIINFWANEKPAKTLVLFGLSAAAMMVVGLLTTGDVALYSFMSGGLFCSVMWPCIFNLAIAGLGKYTNQGSSLLVMMILGGAIIPPLQGLVCDLDHGTMAHWLPISFVQFSYIIAVFCFLYLAWYGYKVKSILLNQGINYDNTSSTGH